jgi:hypothetical protein
MWAAIPMMVRESHLGTAFALGFVLAVALKPVARHRMRGVGIETILHE